jgi:hypothetical protein
MPVDLIGGVMGGKDAAEVTPWMAKGCAAGNQDACGLLSMLAADYAEGKGVAKDIKKAKELYKLACDKGDKESCAAGKALDAGSASQAAPNQSSAPPSATPAATSVPSSATTAASDPREERCAKGEALTCLQLGDESFDPQSATKAGKALPFYARACDGNLSKGCFFAGFIYNQGLGTQKDQVKARPLFVKACADSMAAACAYAGQYWQYGLGGPVDKQEAKKDYQAACDLGFKEACDLIAKVN